MRVILAGATGTLGRVLVPELIRAGHEVVGIARSRDAADRLTRVGAAAIVADVMDRDGLLAAARGESADAVIHELTALKKVPLRHRDMDQTNRLRETGSAHLIELARAVGARRFITQSIVFGYGYRDHGETTLTEASPFGRPEGNAFDPHLAAMVSAERQAMDTDGIEGVALRYGLFYGADIPNMTRMLRRRGLPVVRDGGRLAFVHHEDAATATVAALEKAPPRSVYNIVDDRPATFRELITAVASTHETPAPLVVPQWVLNAAAPYGGKVLGGVSMNVSNAAAKQDLDWAPRYPGYEAALR